MSPAAEHDDFITPCKRVNIFKYVKYVLYFSVYFLVDKYFYFIKFKTVYHISIVYNEKKINNSKQNEINNDNK